MLHTENCDQLKASPPTTLCRTWPRFQVYYVIIGVDWGQLQRGFSHFRAADFWRKIDRCTAILPQFGMYGVLKSLLLPLRMVCLKNKVLYHVYQVNISLHTNFHEDCIWRRVFFARRHLE